VPPSDLTWSLTLACGVGGFDVWRDTTWQDTLVAEKAMWESMEAVRLCVSVCLCLCLCLCRRLCLCLRVGLLADIVGRCSCGSVVSVLQMLFVVVVVATGVCV
jgi:hypothetical protein